MFLSNHGSISNCFGAMDNDLSRYDDNDRHPLYWIMATPQTASP